MGRKKNILRFSISGAGDGLIPPNAKLIFTLTLIKLDKELQIEIIKEGDCSGDQRVREKDKVHLHYIATFADGKKYKLRAKKFNK